jgi:hypothetical protein
LDFVFNRETLSWGSGNIFYYLGVRDESIESNFADNNLSFGFSSDGRIVWKTYRYSTSCSNGSYVDDYYVDTGETPILCTNGTEDDFNITIVFDRHLRLTDCDIENSGGWNDMITGETIVNASDVILSGSTEERVFIETLNSDWYDERYARMGTLKIYLNGQPIYSIKDWEEIIPSTRGFQPFIQSWGGGVTGCNGIHEGVTEFNLKRVKYFEKPLLPLEVKHHYITSTKPLFDITECNDDCEETNIKPFSKSSLLLEDGTVLVTENNNIIDY